MYSSQQSVINLNGTMEEIRLRYEQHYDEQRQKFANQESSWVKTLSQGSSTMSHQKFNLSPPITLPTYSRPPQPPDPPDRNKQRLQEVGFPKFDGTNLWAWIRSCEEHFYLNQTELEMKVRVASPHIVGKALEWHINYLREHYGMFPSWTNFVIALSAKFGGLLDDPISELINLRQAGDSVEVYLGKFQLVLAKLVLPMHHALDIFLKNMVPYLAVYVKQHNVTTVAEAARIAKLHEELQYIPITQPRAPFNPYYKNPYETSRLPPTTATETPNSYEKRQEKRNIEELLHMSYEDVSMSNDEAVHKTDSSQLEKEEPAVLVLGDLQAKDKQDKREHEHTCLATPRLEKGILVVELSESELQHVERNSNNHGEEKLQNNEAHISSSSMSKGLVYEKEEDKLEDKEAIAEKEFVGTKETKVKDVIVKETIQTEESSIKKSQNLGATLDFTLKLHGTGLQIKTESLSPSEEEKELKLEEVTEVFPYHQVLISDSDQIWNHKLQSLRVGINEKRGSGLPISDGLVMIAHGFFDFSVFIRVWEPGGVLIDIEKSKGFYKCDKLVRPMQKLSSIGRSSGWVMKAYCRNYEGLVSVVEKREPRNVDSFSRNVKAKILITFKEWCLLHIEEKREARALFLVEAILVAAVCVYCGMSSNGDEGKFSSLVKNCGDGKGNTWLKWLLDWSKPADQIINMDHVGQGKLLFLNEIPLLGYKVFHLHRPPEFLLNREDEDLQVSGIKGVKTFIFGDKCEEGSIVTGIMAN